MMRRVGVLLMAVLVTGGLAGCGPSGPAEAPMSHEGDRTTTSPEPTVDPETEPDPEPTARPETIPPERPAAMDTVDKAGAEAVAKYFLNLYAYAHSTGDLTAWTELSHPDCVFCSSVIDGVTEMRGLGHTNEGALMIFGDALVGEVDPGRWYEVTINGTQAPWRIVDSNGHEIDARPTPEDHTFRFAVVREADRWLVRAVQVDDAPE